MNLFNTRSLSICAALAICAAPTLSRAQSFPPAWKSTSTYAIGDQVQLNGNVLRATHAVATGSFKYDEWELWEVRANTTLMIGVGQTFTNLASAWAYVENARIADASFLHLYISTAHGHFSEAFTTGFSLDQGSGAKISLIGDNANSITLNFAGDGFGLDTGHSIALLSGLSMVGGAKAGTALPVKWDSSIGRLTDVKISGFPVGIASVQGSSVDCDASVQISNFSNTAIFAATGGTVVCQLDLNINGKAGSIGLQAAYGGIIEAENGFITGCGMGVEAFEGGIVDVETTSFDANTTAISAVDKAQVDATQAQFGTTTANGLDINCATGATVEATGASGSTTLNEQVGGTTDGSYIFGP